MKSRIIHFIFTLAFMLTSFAASAQCAMCRQNAENAAKDNPGIAQGLNSGITYLMFLPYILMLVVALVFWRKKLVSFIRS